MGGADYKSIAPPNSYIDVFNFTGPKDLANYLLHLDNNIVRKLLTDFLKSTLSSFVLRMNTPHF